MCERFFLIFLIYNFFISIPYCKKTNFDNFKMVIRHLQFLNGRDM